MNFGLAAGLLLQAGLCQADPRAEALVHQQEEVEAAAAAVAQARAEGARRRDLAALMATYRTQAELLATMAPPDQVGGEQRARSQALAALVEATADGRADPAARAILATWLGPLEARLTLLEGALTAAATLRVPSLARDMVLDVEEQALALMVGAAHDATEAEGQARQARIRAATLKAATSPERGLSFSAELEAQALLADAASLEAQAAHLWTLRAQAAALRDRARATLQTPPDSP